MKIVALELIFHIGSTLEPYDILTFVLPYVCYLFDDS